MRWRWTATALCGVLLMAFPARAREMYRTVLIEGPAPIVVDGDLSEWDALDLQTGAIDHFIP